MRGARVFVAAVAVVVAATGCSSSGGGDKPVAYGARTCSDWAGRMSDSERWNAAEALLVDAKGTDSGADGGSAPSTGTIKTFEQALSTECDRGASDELLGRLAVEVYQSNRAFYSL